MPDNKTTNMTNEWDGLPMPKRIYAIIAILTGLFMSVVSTSICNVSLPEIAEQLGVSNGLSIWVLNSYQLATIVFLLPLGALGDKFNYRSVYITGIAIFTVSSFCCSISTSFETLVASRIMQGFGSACMTSVNTSLVRTVYPKRYLARGMGFNACVVAISSVSGPTIATIILSQGTWHHLFTVNVPLGMIALLLSWLFMPYNPSRSKNKEIDWLGSFFCMMTVGLMMMSTESFCHNWGGTSTIVLLFGFICFGTILVRNQRSKSEPLLPLDLFKIPIFCLSIGTSLCSFTAQMLVMTSMPFLLKNEMGYTTAEVGMVMTCWPIVLMFVAPMSGFLVEKLHAGLMGGLGLAIMAMGLYGLWSTTAETGMESVCLRMSICGIGFGLFQSPNNSTILSSAPQNRSGGASGMLATARVTGQTLGSSIVALVFYTSPEEGAHHALGIAIFVALAGAAVSMLRVSEKMPQRK